MQYRLDRSKDIVLRHKGHFKIKLIEFTRGAIRPGIFIPEAGGDLEITIKAGDHQQLFELLWCLWQRIELARMQPRRHQEVPRAFWRTGGQDRRLKFRKSLIHHATADRPDDRVAQQDVAVHFFTAQIQEAVLQAYFFWITRILINRHRQGRSSRLNSAVCNADFNSTGRQIGIDGFFGALQHLAGHGNHRFRAQPLDLLQQGRGHIHHTLGQAVIVPQINEQQIAMVALAMNPAGKTNLRTGMVRAKFPTSMRAIGVHQALLQNYMNSDRNGPQVSGAKGPVSARIVKAARRG